MYKMQFDGLAVPNPGELGCGAVIFNTDGRMLYEIGKYIPYGTNNQAEYTGLIIGLEACLENGIKNLYVEGDSKLVVNQINGVWKVKNVNIISYYEKCSKLVKLFDNFEIKHVFREYNKHADSLTNEVFRIKRSFYRKF